jgi:hypothetical protein
MCLLFYGRFIICFTLLEHVCNMHYTLRTGHAENGDRRIPAVAGVGALRNSHAHYLCLLERHAWHAKQRQPEIMMLIMTKSSFAPRNGQARRTSWRVADQLPQVDGVTKQMFQIVGGQRCSSVFVLKTY